MKKYSVYVIIGLVITGFVLSYFFNSKGSNKIVYVELAIVYNEFPMKKELEAKLTNVQNARKNILDSLKIQLNAFSLSIKSDKDVQAIQQFQIKKQEYLVKQRSFEEDNQSATQSYSDQIWKQINQYVKDYGKEKGYTYILGTDGSGIVMYADESKNITKELSNYVNERYKGEQK